MVIKATYPAITQAHIELAASQGTREGKTPPDIPVSEMVIDLIQAACDWKRYAIAVDNNIRRDSDGLTASAMAIGSHRQVEIIAACIVAAARGE